MSGEHLVREVPKKPISLDEVLRRWPIVRQSDLAKMDECALAGLFNIRHHRGWSNHDQARGLIEHQVFAECLRTMKANDSEFIPPEEARTVLYEKLRQRDVEPAERVRVPIRELPVMEMAVVKWAYDNRWTIRNLVDTERRLECIIPYRTEHGELIERRFSGQLDVLMSRGSDEAICVDFKGGWRPPPLHDEDDKEPGLSNAGYFQQQAYAALIFANYPSVQAVVLQEFYQRRSQSRPARLTRQELPKVMERLSVLIEAFDMALAAGQPERLTIDDLEAHGHWKPSPGYACRYCSHSRYCPVDDEIKNGSIHNQADAERLAGAWLVEKAAHKKLGERLSAWAEVHGPIPLKRAKGRMVLGHRPIANGKTRFGDYTPEGADRLANRVPYNPNSDLAQAMRDSVAEAREQKAAKAADA